MTCADVMTVNPMYCEPGDSAARAAQIMKDEDVGPVPVVNNTSEKRLIGIVTDRDLALQVVAAGRDANSTRLEQLMTRQPVTCREDDDARDAMEAMSRNQVRRIPVVDSQDRLVGIIAQADLARRLSDDETGDMLEDISQPGRNAISRTYNKIAHSSESASGMSDMAGFLVAGGLGMAMGATLMCLFDPTRGQARRARISSVAQNAYDQSAQAVNKAGRVLSRQQSEESPRVPEPMSL